VQKRSLKKLIEKAFGVDERVRFVALYQDQYILAGGMRPNLASYDPEDESRSVDLQLAKIGEIVRTWQRWFGKLSRFTLKYEKINLVFQPLGEGRFLVLSGDSDFDPSIVLQRLRDDQDYKLLMEGIP